MIQCNTTNWRSFYQVAGLPLLHGLLPSVGQEVGRIAGRAHLSHVVLTHGFCCLNLWPWKITGWSMSQCGVVIPQADRSCAQSGTPRHTRSCFTWFCMLQMIDCPFGDLYNYSSTSKKGVNSTSKSAMNSWTATKDLRCVPILLVDGRLPAPPNAWLWTWILQYSWTILNPLHWWSRNQPRPPGHRLLKRHQLETNVCIYLIYSYVYIDYIM